jgi:CelD/BcsL family acetyltransferase involved in cellulose biosynthesis
VSPSRATDPALRIHRLDAVPPEWPDLLTAAAAHHLAHDPRWIDLACRHLPGARPHVVLVETGGELVGGLVAVRRRRRGLDRLESSYDGVPAGPLLRADLPPDLRADVFAALCGALADSVAGRTLLAVQTLADPRVIMDADRLPAPWRRHAYHTSVLDCRGGIDHVGRELWTNNRRNERNRGLKRGCVLEATGDPATVAAWYPLYAAASAAWAQAPLPLALMRDALRTAPDRFVMIVCRLEGEVIGGHFCYRSDGRLVAWQGAARPDTLRTVFTTTLLYWQDAVVACAEGLSGVDYGGHVGRDSLADFKRRCGAWPEPRLELVALSPLGHLVRRAAATVRRVRGRP